MKRSTMNKKGENIRKERKRKRKKIETIDIRRKEDSRLQCPCHIVPSVSPFQIPVLSSGRFRG